MVQCLQRLVNMYEGKAEGMIFKGLDHQTICFFAKPWIFGDVETNEQLKWPLMPNEA